MNQEPKNDVLICVSLLERSITLLKENTRETIKRSTVEQIKKNLESILIKLTPYCKEVMILSPIMEIIELISIVVADETFVETDNETKVVMVDKLKSSLYALYLFAGKFYMTNEFSFSLGTADILKRIVDGCLNNNFYFGIDEQLRREGVID